MKPAVRIAVLVICSQHVSHNWYKIFCITLCRCHIWLSIIVILISTKGKWRTSQQAWSRISLVWWGCSHLSERQKQTQTSFHWLWDRISQPLDWTSTLQRTCTQTLVVRGQKHLAVPRTSTFTFRLSTSSMQPSGKYTGYEHICQCMRMAGVFLSEG